MSPGPGLHHTPLPQGFFASGVNCGVRRYRPDLGLLYTERPCVAAGVFTINEAKAAPVRHSQALLPSANIRALVTNSGQANAATGRQGRVDNQRMVDAIAAELRVAADQVLTASTGVIGKVLEIEKIENAVPELVARAADTAGPFALAILTTDLVPKSVTTVVPLSGGPVRVTGICKGSGMIHPNMATMLGYLLTDARLTPAEADAYLRNATDVSFNMISVDGDCSTNDSCFLMASGATEIAPVTAEDRAVLGRAFTEVAQFLAKAIASDGEGATKLIEVALTGAPTLDLARRAARGVTLSPLVKTAMHGEDPNWGRILSRLGAEKVPEDCLANMSLRLQGELLFADGRALEFDREAVRALLKRNQVRIEIDLRSGTESAVAWGCDLSRKYVDINTEYT